MPSRTIGVLEEDVEPARDVISLESSRPREAHQVDLPADCGTLIGARDGVARAPPPLCGVVEDPDVPDCCV